MSSSTLIVTLAVGDRYLRAWKECAEPSWKKYAETHNYDLLCIDKPLDESDRAKSRSVAWQKCLILDQPFSQKYERVIWIDSDIVINASRAPSIVDGVPIDKVGAVDAFSIPSQLMCQDALQRCFEWWQNIGSTPVLETTPEEYHSNYGFPSRPLDGVVQSGVMVLSPRYHRELLSRTYYNYEDKGDSRWHYEERPLSWELLTNGAVHWIDYRFNALWILFKALHYPFLLTRPKQPFSRRVIRKLVRTIGGDPDLRIKQACVNAAFLDTYFMHFGATMDDMPLVNPELSTWQECFM